MLSSFATEPEHEGGPDLRIRRGPWTGILRAEQKIVDLK